MLDSISLLSKCASAMFSIVIKPSRNLLKTDFCGFFFFRHIALNYAGNHPEMSDPNRPGCENRKNPFARQGGITNGAAWYSVAGGKGLSINYVTFLGGGLPKMTWEREGQQTFDR